MTQFYFLRTSLPEIQIDAPLPLPFDELMYMLRHNLSDKEWMLIGKIRLYYDLLNLNALLRELPIDEKGILEGNSLEKAVQSKEYFPTYVFDFFEEYTSKEEQVRHFGRVIATLFSRGNRTKSRAFA